MKYIFVILSLFLVGCAQITYNITVTGSQDTTIKATGAVDKTTDDLMDLAGSAYGSAETNPGAK